MVQTAHAPARVGFKPDDVPHLQSECVKVDGWCVGLVGRGELGAAFFHGFHLPGQRRRRRQRRKDISASVTVQCGSMAQPVENTPVWSARHFERHYDAAKIASSASGSSRSAIGGRVGTLAGAAPPET